MMTMTKVEVDETPGACGAGLPLPTPVRLRYGMGAEYKLMRIRDCNAPDSAANTPETVYDFWKANVEPSQWFDTEKECLVVFFLSVRRLILGYSLISLGTLDTILVHPREVFRPAIVAGAAVIVLAHNHPSGDPTPSEADIKVTRDLIRAGQIVKIELLDHLVVGQQTATRSKAWTSLRELGYFYS